MPDKKKIGLRDYMAGQGWEVDYQQTQAKDDRGKPFTSGNITMTNPQTGLAHTFTQGKGDKLGVGHFEGGQHYITDKDKLYGMMTRDVGQTDMTKGQLPYEYDRQFLTDEAIGQRMGAMDKPFDYDPHQDQMLQRAQEQAKEGVMRHLAEHGLAPGSATQVRMQQASQDLIPEYEQMAYGRHMDEIQHNYQMLAQKAQLEDISYREFMDMQNYEIQQYGIALTPELREHTQVAQSMDPELMRDLEWAYGDDFAHEINKRREQNPEDPLIPMLEALRANKVLRDPSLLHEYGRAYGLSSAAIAERAATYERERAQQRSAEIDAQIKQLELEYMPTQIRQMIERGEYENAILSTEAQYADELMQLQMRQLVSNIEASEASAAESRARTAAQARKDEEEQLKGMKTAPRQAYTAILEMTKRADGTTAYPEASFWAQNNMDYLINVLNLDVDQAEEVIERLQHSAYVDVIERTQDRPEERVQNMLQGGKYYENYKLAMGSKHYNEWITAMREKWKPELEFTGAQPTPTPPPPQRGDR